MLNPITKKGVETKTIHLHISFQACITSVIFKITFNKKFELSKYSDTCMQKHAFFKNNIYNQSETLPTTLMKTIY